MADVRTYKRPSNDSPEIKIVLALLKGLYWLVSRPFERVAKPAKRRPASSLDVAEISARWADIGTTVALGGATHFGAAVVAADKLLDYVLRHKGYGGESMGERLRSAQGDLSAKVYDGLWRAHKLRNTLVHEVHAEVMSYEAKEALERFEVGLRELGGIK